MYVRGQKGINILGLFRSLWSFSKIQGVIWVVKTDYEVGLRGMVL
jgi:hypothetical protein